MLIDFLDEFEENIKSHTVHQKIVSTEMREKLNYDRNVRPLIIRRDMDFSEN